MCFLARPVCGIDLLDLGRAALSSLFAQGFKVEGSCLAVAIFTDHWSCALDLFLRNRKSLAPVAGFGLGVRKNSG